MGLGVEGLGAGDFWLLPMDLAERFRSETSHVFGKCFNVGACVRSVSGVGLALKRDTKREGERVRDQEPALYYLSIDLHVVRNQALRIQFTHTTTA